jgi:hypothetical protein
MKKSYWQSVSIHDDRSKEALHSWFRGMSEGMTPCKAEVLCDIETDREKKLRAIMTNSDGERYEFTRTVGARFTVSSKKLTHA